MCVTAHCSLQLADFFLDEVMFSFVLTGQQEHVKYRWQSSVWRGQTQRRIIRLIFSILQSGSCLVLDGCPTGKNCILPNTSEQPLNRHQICQLIGRIPLWSSLCSTKNNNKLLKNRSSCENEIGFKKIVLECGIENATASEKFEVCFWW